ncbi:LOC101835362 [Phodopus roborovskii]|uniref:stearoyl-CoA 9-desaturase n=1 Tax=Phodopus roborovskii TaxID=109678 RepID=A0AAU9ZYQ8_PHORO|nr:LOC101835362 [Phodopus roborovskii]
MRTCRAFFGLSLLPLHMEMTSSYITTTTITAPLSGSLQNRWEKQKTVPLYWEEDIRPEMKEDIYDPSYQDEEGPPPKLEYVWRNIILMALLHLGALYGVILVPSCKIYTCLFAFVYYVISIEGIGAGVHRLWSHRTYKARLPLRLFLIVANTMAFQVSSCHWGGKQEVEQALQHNHYHIVWLLWSFGCAISPRRYYKPGILLMCFILPTLVPWYCWGETFLNSLCVSTFLRYATVLNVTWLVNSAAHLYGYRPYDKNIDPRENTLVSLGCLGEGFHNYHHAFPYDYSASEYRWHINFTTFFIDCMAALGLAYDRKRVSKAALLARIKRTGDGSHKSG